MKSPGPVPNGPVPPLQELDEDQPHSFRENLGMVWRLRSHFRAFLIPGIGLLVLALVQADLALTATTAGQRLIDRFASRSGPTAAAAAAPAPAPPEVSRTPTERLLNTLARGGSATRLAVLMAVFLLVAEAVAIAIEQFRNVINARFRERIQAKLVTALSWELAGKRGQRSTGNTAQIFMTDAAQLSGLLVFGVVIALENVVKLGVYTSGLARIESGWLIVAVAVPATVLFQTAVARFFIGRETSTIEGSERLNVQLRSRTAELFDVLSRLVYFRGDRRQADRVLKLSADSARAGRRLQLVSSMRGSVMGIVTTLSLPLVVVLLSLSTAALVAAGPDGNTAGMIVQAQALLMLVTMTTSVLVGIPSMLAQSSPSVRRVEEILNIPEPEPEPAELPRLRASSSPPALTVRGLSFQYPGMTRPLLHDVSFQIPAGACVGVIGGSGCGKSTLARLLVGDLRPASGSVLLDGIDVTEWHLWWKREVVGFLPAEQGFLRGTLEENVLFGRNREAVREYDEAIAVSGVTAIASAKADQGGMQMYIDSRVDDFLSTGERRRVGIARLLLGDQRFWIFDEPGSGLDPRTMVEIAGALSPSSRVIAGRTCIIITHDPDVFETDFNVFVQDGTVADIGRHAELLQRSAAYASLVGRHVKERVEHVADTADVAVPASAPFTLGSSGKRPLAIHLDSPQR